MTSKDAILTRVLARWLENIGHMGVLHKPVADALTELRIATMVAINDAMGEAETDTLMTPQEVSQVYIGGVPMTQQEASQHLGGMYESDNTSASTNLQPSYVAYSSAFPSELVTYPGVQESVNCDNCHGCFSTNVYPREYRKCPYCEAGSTKLRTY